jgi:hypothetical protein
MESDHRCFALLRRASYVPPIHCPWSAQASSPAQAGLVPIPSASGHVHGDALDIPCGVGNTK